MLNYFKRSFGLTKPIYNELSTYLTALTCIALLFTHPDLISSLFKTLDRVEGFRQIISVLVLGFIALSGFLLSMVHVFIRREKSSFEKYCMGAFAIGTNAFAGIVAGMEELISGDSILVLFPLWNIGMGIIMSFQIRYRTFEVTDEEVSLLQVAGASLALLLVFASVTFAFRLSLAMTFSICMFYSSSLIFFATWLINQFKMRSLSED